MWMTNQKNPFQFQMILGKAYNDIEDYGQLTLSNINLQPQRYVI